MTQDQPILIAERHKTAGNDFFRSGKLQPALDSYSLALSAAEGLDGTATLVQALLANRAFVHLKMENYGSALADATLAITIDANFTKGYYRRACAHFSLQKYKEAQKDFQRVCNDSPKDVHAAARLRECKRLLKQQRFAEAIAVDDVAKPSEVVDIATMEVPAGYSGPRLDDPEQISPEFLTELMDYVKVVGNTLPKKYAYTIVLAMIKLLQQSSSLVRVTIEDDTDFTVCGDIHGQFYDLLNIFEMNGLPGPTKPYLFNGDFVDRGSFSIEVILTLYAAKLLYPSHFHLARGNHETRNMNKIYGFFGEVTAKYDEMLYNLFCESFCLLPLAHVLNEKIFVVHGGLFEKDGVTLADIEAINRNCEPPESGIMTDLLWSDPQDDDGRAPSRRGVTSSFGPDVTKRFLEENGLEMVIRSHEMRMGGYSVAHDGKLVTIFSAPNYCDQMENSGAYMRIKGSDLSCSYHVFDAVAHPQVQAMQYANPFLSF